MHESGSHRKTLGRQGTTLLECPRAAVAVVARVGGFASLTNAYTFHCHFSTHEEGGVMGQFLVVP